MCVLSASINTPKHEVSVCRENTSITKASLLTSKALLLLLLGEKSQRVRDSPLKIIAWMAAETPKPSTRFWGSTQNEASGREK